MVTKKSDAEYWNMEGLKQWVKNNFPSPSIPVFHYSIIPSKKEYG